MNESILIESAGRRLLSIVICCVMICSALLVTAHSVGAGPVAVFSPPHSDHGLDTNANGAYDELVVDAVVSVSSEGWYTVTGGLYDGGANWIDSASARVYLFLGTDTVSLSFSGIDIYIDGSNGPYSVNLAISDDSGVLDTDIYATSAYLHNQFEHFSASFTPPHTDHGIDTDGNGLFNEIVVDASFSVLVAGWFTIDAALEDNASQLIDSSSTYVLLSAGPTSAEFTFPWQDIFCHGVNGPYKVEFQISVYDTARRVLDSDTHITSSYALSNFEHAVFSPPHSAHTVDLNSNLRWDRLIVDAVVSVTVAGWYEVDGGLFHNASTLIDTGSATAYLTAGAGVVHVPFYGTAIYSHGFNGPYLVALQLRDTLPMPYTHLFSNGTYTTSAYLYTAFDGAYFSAPHSDHGVDSNSNGLFDQLVVGMNVTSSTAGSYTVVADLRDSPSITIQMVSSPVSLHTGLNTVSLSFSGMIIRAYGAAGPYTVAADLYDGSSRLLSSVIYLTHPYASTSFDYAVLSPPHSDHGVDSNGNGLFDELVVDVNVNVSSEGWFWVNADLENNMSAGISSASSNVYLFEGKTTVPLAFPWQDICSHGENGPYHVLLTLADSSDVVTLDTQTYLTAAYPFTAFDRTYLSPPHSDHGVDTNGNGLFDRLAVDINMSASISGLYWIYGNLYDSLDNSIDSQSTEALLAYGANSLEMAFPWQTISGHGADGPYTLDILLYDDNGTYLGSGVYSTRAYLVSEFEHAWFAPPHSDHGVDLAGYGLYSQLAVEVSVNISTEGWYSVAGTLFDDVSNQIEIVTSYTLLHVGLDTVPLNFSGVNICANGVDGPYILTLSLTDSLGRGLDSDTHVTGPYTVAMFEPAILSPPHSIHLVDSNGNGFYEQLVIDVGLYAALGGSYSVEGLMHDMAMNLIETRSVDVVLAPGQQTVPLAFNGTAISGSRTSGPYDIELVLRDSVGTAIDNGTYITAAYQWTSFEVNFTMHLSPGWNFVSVPLSEFDYNASRLGLASGDEVASWNPLLRAYDQDYIVGLSPVTADFSLLPGLGYWIYSHSGEDIHLLGGVLTSAQYRPVNVPSGGGWAVVGLSSLDTAKHASDLVPRFSGCSVTDIARWNPSKGSYDAFIVGVDPSAYDFALSPGEAYWVWVTASGTMAYGP